jgi:hypothetical protein
MGSSRVQPVQKSRFKQLPDWASLTLIEQTQSAVQSLERV